VWSLWSEPVRRPVAVAWLVQGLLHVGYHVGHLDGFGTADEVGMVVSLAAIPVLALVALWAGAGSGAKVAAPQP